MEQLPKKKEITMQIGLKEYQLGFNECHDAYTKAIIERLEKKKENLEDKRKCFIGCLRDEVTKAESKGFKQGLSWAIESFDQLIKEIRGE